ncbi:ras association domain-containing protein 1 homolog [Corticium candelabrum]|uniref:ras association domain-containing protein 1 homolog n=1 Tax=Corticium candelabrum TaxID=121492 RepID=UPI002E26EAE4|nr:ras association domain-containing protein 1 homolog [Corticium candelabrum]
MMSGKRESSPLLRQRSESPVIIHSPIEIPTSDAQNGGNGTPRSPRRLGFIRHGIEQIATWSRSKTAKQKRRQNVTSLVGNRSSFIAAGHDYEVVSLTNPHWCDHCGDFIWGLFTTAVRCKRCNITCHRKCRYSVVLDCRGPLKLQARMSRSDAGNQSWDVDITRDVIECVSGSNSRETSPCPVLLSPAQVALDDVTLRIEEYNRLSSNGRITLSDNGTVFHGPIRVHLVLDHPIHVLAALRPAPSLKTAIPAHSSETYRRQRSQSFFIPSDTVKTLHVDSNTTAYDVIVTLLDQFKVSDSPAKFSLLDSLEDDLKGGQKLADDDKPLVVVMNWGAWETARHLCLVENKESTIDWHSFATAELENFLLMLKKEEDRHEAKVRIFYKRYRENLVLAIREKYIALSGEGSRV